MTSQYDDLPCGGVNLGFVASCKMRRRALVSYWMRPLRRGRRWLRDEGSRPPFWCRLKNGRGCKRRPGRDSRNCYLDQSRALRPQFRREAGLRTPASRGVRVNHYLLDTNVISEARKPRPHGAVMAWISAMEEARLFVVRRNAGRTASGDREDKTSRSLEGGRIGTLGRSTCRVFSCAPYGYGVLSGMGPHYGQEAP